MSRFSWRESGRRTDGSGWLRASTIGRGGRNWRGPRGSSGSTGSPIHSSWEALSTINLLGEITLEAVVSSIDFKEVAPSIQDSEVVASYNWLDRAKATILVPGGPPVWTPPGTTSTLQPDSGTYFRDPNAARYPRYPTEPAMRAIFAMRPDLDTAIDVVGCGSTMGNLLRFAASKESTFRFNMEIIGDTIFLVRKENSPQEIIDGVYGYGHTFPDSYTTWAPAVKGSVSSQRLVRYKFGGLTCLVRFESDGYLKDKTMDDEDSLYTQLFVQSDHPQSSKTSESNTLLLDFKSASVSEKSPEKDSIDLTIELGGCLIPQQAVFDLKTRSARSAVQIIMDDVYPRLWVSQIPNFIIGYHQSGKFDDVRVIDVRVEVNEWERKNADVLRQFQSTLRKLIRIAKESDCRKFELRRIAQGPLQIWKLRRDSWAALPRDLKVKWSAKEIDEDEDLEDSRSETMNEGMAADDEDPDDYLKF
ncbi:hypothetical protein MMC17_005262 [Xylographa soralifera]|nr:hypothetical protein [Xylographa soralifera]